MKYLNKLNVLLQCKKNEIIKFLSSIIKIKSYSNEESEIVKFIVLYLKNNIKKKYKSKINIKKIKNNIIIFIGNLNTNCEILYDAHIDTIPAENQKSWTFNPFSGKILNDKIYGRGSCDDKSSVAALVFTSLFLYEVDYNLSTIAFSLSSNEENSSGKGIEEVLSYVKPKYCVICEPSDLKIVYGHKGKWSFKITFYGKSLHASNLDLKNHAIYAAYPVIKNIFEEKNKNYKNSLLRQPTFTITLIESKTNSLNSTPHQCSLYIDYRSVLGETQNTIKNFVLKNVKNKYLFTPIHKFFPAWVIKKDHPLVSRAKNTFKVCFTKEPNLILWQFCTNGSITMVEHKIPTIGFGPGSPYLAHKDNEYVKINDVFDAIRFYFLLPFLK